MCFGEWEWCVCECVCANGALFVRTKPDNSFYRATHTYAVRSAVEMYMTEMESVVGRGLRVGA